jgi:hypothetical protein
MQNFRRFMRRHHKLATAMWVLVGYLLHLTVEGTVFAFLGAKAQAAGWITI